MCEACIDCIENSRKIKQKQNLDTFLVKHRRTIRFEMPLTMEVAFSEIHW